MGWLDLLIFLFHPNQHEKGRQIIQNFRSHIDKLSSTQQVVDAAGSVGSIMESFDNENEDKRTQQASHKQTNKQKLGPADAAGEWITVSHKQTNKRGQADTAGEPFSMFSTSFTKLFPWIKPKLLGVVLWGAGKGCWSVWGVRPREQQNCRR